MDDRDTQLIEFKQAYDRGVHVLKRGLTASPLLVKKYGLTDDEFMAFSSCQGRGRAVTAFHFHPAYPWPERRPAMEAHHEGRTLLTRDRGEDRARLEEHLRQAGARFHKTARGAGSAVNAMLGAAVIAFLHGQIR